MKRFKFLFVAIPVIMMACNSQPKADKNMQDDAILMEDAKVKEEKEDKTRVERRGSDTTGIMRDTINRK